MPKAAAQQYTDLQAALDAIQALETSARNQNDKELESAARRARKELANPKTGGPGNTPVASVRRVQ